MSGYEPPEQVLPDWEVLKRQHDSIIETAERLRKEKILKGLTQDFNIIEGDVVNHPTHYTKHPSGVECIEITEHMNFCLGTAVKYIWRAGLKNKNAKEDLEKAIWYLNRELERIENESNK